MIAYLQQRWFLLALLAVLAVGMIWAGPLRPMADAIPSTLVVASVMFLMALPLESAALWRAFRHPGPAWLAVLINSGLAPPVGWLAGRWLPEELAVGVIVATTVPCTLAGATVWTRRAGGSEAVAILVTMITNLACFLVVPFWLRVLLGTEASVDYTALVWQLVLLVVVPIALAQLLRQWALLGTWAGRHKLLLSELAQAGILGMVFVGAVGCGERIRQATDSDILSAMNVTVMIVAVTVAHGALLIAGLASSGALGMPRPDRIAVAIAGSQKTIMVGLYIALEFGPLAILPMVAYHAVQLIIDTFLADWWRHRHAPPLAT